MDILFLEIDTDAEWAVCSLGPAFLASVARNAGHTATMLRLPYEEADADVLSKIRAAKPDLIGISMTTRQWMRGKHLANLVKSEIDVPILVGGLHPTFSPEDVLKEPGIDAVCLGEGEAPFATLLAHLEKGELIADVKIKNIWLKGGTHPGLSPPIEDINSIPFMARDFMDERYGVVHMSTQRGCPFPCTYCAARMYDQLYESIGKYGRRRSLESVLTELETIRDNDLLNYVIFLDDTFTINHPWVFEFAKEYPKRIGKPFSIHARAETMNPKLIEALAKAGCYHVVYGVESGSERMRREVMKRPVTNERLVEIFDRTRDAGMLVTANYMMGVPGETKEDMQATIDLHHLLKPLDYGYFVFYPFPGTQLFQVCKQAGYLPENWQELPARHDHSILDLPEISKQDIRDVFDQWTEIRAQAELERAAPEGAVSC